MQKEDLEKIIQSNEKEWRRTLWKRFDRLEERFNSFQIKALSFIIVLTAGIELAVKYYR